MNDFIIKANDLSSSYGLSQVLFGMNLSVKQGETLALLGRNGVGKSTTMKTLMGILKTKEGAAYFNEQKITGMRHDKIAKMGIGYVPEDRQVFSNHTVEDNLRLGAKKGPDGQDEWSLEVVYKKFPLLRPLKARRAGLLSGGEQQMLSLARALMGNPTVLLLDEPSEGLAPLIVQQIGDVLKQLSKQGLTIVLAEQNMRFCLDIATRATIIDHGTSVFEDSIDALVANQEIIDKYLSI